jgi:hypothetical protein
MPLTGMMLHQDASTHRSKQKMDFFLWSTAAVAQLILRETGLTLSERSTGKYLKRWGFSPQKPVKRAYEQSPKAVQSWLDHEYPAIEVSAEAVENYRCNPRSQSRLCSRRKALTRYIYRWDYLQHVIAHRCLEYLLGRICQRS